MADKMKLLSMSLLMIFLSMNLRETSFGQDNSHIIMEFDNVKSTFIRIDELKIDGKYVTLQQLFGYSTPQILSIDEIYHPLENRTYHILNLYWWDLRSPSQPNVIYKLQNSLVLGGHELCYFGFSGRPKRYNSESRVQYMLRDSKNAKLLLYELDSEIVRSEMQRQTGEQKFTFKDTYSVKKFPLKKEMNPKSAAYGHITNFQRNDVIIETDPEYYSEGSSSYLSILSKDGSIVKESWRSKGRFGSILHMETTDIDEDGLDEVIIQPISEIYSEDISVYKWIDGQMKQIGSHRVASRGYQWCIADVDNDNVHEIIILGQSPDEEKVLMLAIYKYDKKAKQLKQILKRQLKRELGDSTKHHYYDFCPIGVTEVDGKWKIIFAFNYSTWNGSLANNVMLYYLDEVVFKNRPH